MKGDKQNTRTWNTMVIDMGHVIKITTKSPV